MCSRSWRSLSSVCVAIATAVIWDDRRPVTALAATAQAGGAAASTTTATASTTTAPHPSTTTTTTTAPATTTSPTTTAPPPVRGCERGDLAVQIEVPRSSYAVGEVIEIRVRATNVSTRDCRWTDSKALLITDSNGREVFRGGDITDYAGGDPVWSPGQSGTHIHRWSGEDCSQGGPCAAKVPPGTYTIEAYWDRHGPARTTVQLTAPS